jgi:HAD superfamily hydrolase (TIGR01549 family)
MIIRAVLFDWDGTIVDSAEASFRCYQRLFGSFGLTYEREDFARTYSPDWYRTYEALGLARERWPEADARWLALYAAEKSALVAGARPAMDALRRAGLRAGIVTSGSRSRVEPEISALGLQDVFHTVVCSDDCERRKPHPEPLRLALGRLGVSSAETAYVGDSPEDVEMARAAGSLSVGIAGGFPNREALALAAPDIVAASLEAAVEEILRIAGPGGGGRR